MTPHAPAAEPRFPVTFGDVARVIAVTLVFGALVIGLLAGFAAAGVDFARVQGTQLLAFITVMIQGAYIVGCIYFVIMRRRRLGWRDIGLRRVGGRWILAAALTGAVCVPVVSVLTFGLLTVLGQPLENPQITLLAPEGYTLLGLFGMLLAAGIVQPFAEELAFRGVLYKLLRNYWPVFPAALVSGLMFGALHYFPQVIAGTTLLGILMALLYERSGSLWVPVVLHVTYNSASLIMLYAFLYMGIDFGPGTEALLLP